ncbi:Catsper1, partial [Symbiodinium sp. CCMP2456]
VSLKVPEPEHPRRVRKEYTSSDTESGKPHHKHINANQLLHALSSEDDVRLGAYMVAAYDDDDDLDVLMKPQETESEHRARLSKMTRLERIADWFESAQYEMLIAAVLCFNVLWMALEAQVDGYRSGHTIGVFETVVVSDATWAVWEIVFAIGDITFTAFFVLDVLVRIAILRCKFWKVPMNYIDVAVSGTSLLEIVLFYALSANLAVNPILFRLLRIGKLARAIRMITMNSVLASLHLLIRCLAASTNILFWTFCLIAFFQCVSGMVANTLCRDFINDENQSLQVREDVFRYYGTFSRTFLSMFELLFANWSPPCRVLVENISEWFSVYFLLYRCVLGYAVLNVVSAVFVQQTMKTASSDEELAFKQKERAARATP